MHPTVTLLNPKSITREREFVLIPKKEYEDLRERAVPEVTLTPRERRMVARGRREVARGEWVSLSDLSYVVGRTGHKKRG